jgi:hypothetical protein
MDNSLVRIVAFIIAAALIAWQVSRRWNMAGEVSNAENEEKRVWKAGFQSFKQHPTFETLKKYIDSKYPNTFDKPTDSQTYQIVHLVPLNELGQPIPFEAISQAKSLVAYLKNSQKKLMVSLDLQTNQIYEQELSSMAFSSMIPYWAGN